MKATIDPRLVSVTLLAAALMLGVLVLRGPIEVSLAAKTIETQFERLILLHATLPRLAMAVLCGAGLALSGAILQQVLRNPLVAPDTLAVSAGARLTLGLVTLFAPGLFGFGRDLVAIVGAVAAAALVLAISRSRKYSPVSMILAGLVVSLYCGALSIVLVLLKDRYLIGLFIWGSGSLSQQSWEPAIQLAIRLVICGGLLILLLRPLSVLDAGEDVARNVGVPVERIRLLATGVAVLLAAFITSAVGVIGFIGLAAPALATFCGVQRFPARCLWSAIMGGMLLLVTDLLVQLLSGDGAFIPTGAVTAVIGSPLLLLLLSRLQSRQPQPPANEALATPRFIDAKRRARLLALLGVLALLGFAALVLIGRGADGSWSILGGETLADVLPWRLPRMLAAAGAGGLLAIGGYVLQRVTQNPLASPEIMGVSAGAIMGAAIALSLAGTGADINLGPATAIGSLAALLFVLAMSLRRSAAPERILLAGVALTALVDAVVGLIIASGGPSSVLLLAWLAGSASDMSLPVATGTLAAAGVLLLVGLIGSRWLAVLSLGTSVATGIGLRVPVAQGALLVLVAVTTAIATPVIGPLTFVGLMAPHLVRMLGVRSAPVGLVMSTLTGGALMIVADTLARTIAFPLQLPTGILASLLACPVLLLLIAMGNKR
jgi:iron complex transport system permease protein